MLSFAETLTDTYQTASSHKGENRFYIFVFCKCLNVHRWHRWMSKSFIERSQQTFVFMDELQHWNPFMNAVRKNITSVL